MVIISSLYHFQMNENDDESDSMKQFEIFDCIDKKFALTNARITKINKALIDSMMSFDEYVKQINIDISKLGENTKYWVRDLESNANEVVNKLYTKNFTEILELRQLLAKFQNENQELRSRIENLEREYRPRIENLERDILLMKLK
jgi:S-ribosylhomocysteine lyase LuxS involved in autoinducer biosynthesis